MTHSATSRFWRCYTTLPKDIQTLADKSYALLKSDPKHPSLHFKKLGDVWSVRVGEGRGDVVTLVNQHTRCRPVSGAE